MRWNLEQLSAGQGCSLFKFLLTARLIAPGVYHRAYKNRAKLRLKITPEWMKTSQIVHRGYVQIASIHFLIMFP